MAEFFRFLVETNLITAAFIIGAISFVIAVIGKFKTIIEPSPTMRLVLALFGLFLMVLSVGGYFLSSQTTPQAEEIPTLQPTATPPVEQLTATSESSTQSPQISPTPKPTVSSEQPPSNCIAEAHTPLAQGDHTFVGPVHVVQLWRQNGQSPWGSREVMTVVVGDVTIIGAGGSVWTYPSSECEAVARIHMLDGAESRGSIVVTPEELRAAGMVK